MNFVKGKEVNKRMDTILTAILAAAALLASMSFAYKTFFARTADVSGAPKLARKTESWPRALSIGHRLSGSDSAPVSLIVLTDLECPACRGFHNGALADLVKKYGDSLRVSYVQHPLSYHKLALPAARATECIASSNRLALAQWFDVVFSKQDSLGIKSYGSFAEEAGVSDTAQIAQCTKSTTSFSRIEAGLELGREIRLVGTPTVIVNGWILPDVPSVATIDSIFASQRKDKR